MKEKRFFLSIIIIGYNTSRALKNCLHSLNLQKLGGFDAEIIYVDDGSIDDSVKIFKNFPLNYHKELVIHNNNLGRNHARNSGIKKAQGLWCFFTNSNIELEENILKNYINFCTQSNAIGFVGPVFYTCNDKRFENYLNKSWRGVLKLKSGDVVPPNLLLFSNLFIQRKILERVGEFNKEFNGYGGSEFEMAARITKIYPNSFEYLSFCTVTRSNHPSLRKHLKRIEEFGSGNLYRLLKLLDTNLIPLNFALTRFFYCRLSMVFIPFLYLFQGLFLIIYNIVPIRFVSFIIKFLLGISLVKGVSFSKYAR